MHPLALLTALALGAATAFLVACGSNDNLIPSGDASSLENALEQVASDFDAGRCQAAEQAVSKLNGELVNLPDSVDSRLRSRLRSGVAHLDERVRATCTETQTQQTQTQTQQETQTNEQTDTDTDSETDTGTTSTGTTSTGTTSTGTTSTGTTTGGTTTGDTTGGDTTGGVGGDG